MFVTLLFVFGAFIRTCMCLRVCVWVSMWFTMTKNWYWALSYWIEFTMNSFNLWHVTNETLTSDIDNMWFVYRISNLVTQRAIAPLNQWVEQSEGERERKRESTQSNKRNTDCVTSTRNSVFFAIGILHARCISQLSSFSSTASTGTSDSTATEKIISVLN